MLAATMIFSSGCFVGDPGEDGTAGGQAFEIDGQFVIIWNGHDQAGRITYVVVRNWPDSSTPEDRLADKRLLLSGAESPKIRLPDGRYQPVAGTPFLYFYDGDKLTSFPISMQESDWVSLRTKAMTSYADLLRFFTAYAAK